MTVDSKLGAVRSGVRPLERDPKDAAGLLLGRLTVLPALVILPFLLAGFPLLVIGYFKPIPVIVLWLVLAALIIPYVWRRIPSVTGAGLWGTVGQDWAKPTPRWTLWALIAVSAAFGIFNAVYHSQFIIDEYDAASYMQFANWISGHGTTIIPENTQYFGGSHPADITFASAAFFQQNGHLVPQFMAGLPMVLATGFWMGGARLAVFWAPALGALAVFTFGGLVARLVGPRWAPFAALAIAVSVPMQYTSRSTWSEPLALIFLIAGLSVWIDSQHTDWGPEDAGPWRTDWRHHLRSSTHVLAGTAGLLLGIVFLVRLDGPADIMLIIPFCGLLLLRRQRQVVPLIGGLIVGTLYGAIDCVFVTLPYVDVNKKSVAEMAAGIVVLLVGTAVAMRRLRRRGSDLTGQPKPLLVKAVTILPFFVVAVFLARPYVERGWVTNYLHDYSALSLHWIYWYTGAVTIAFAVLAYAVLGRRAIKREAQVWVLPLLVFACATGIFLLEPSITPHQPYASRRLVPAVLPGLILLATWTASWLSRKSRVIHLVNVPAFLQRSPRVVVSVACMAAIAVPALYGNATGLALKQTFYGEVAAVNELCAEIPKNVSVLFIDNNNLELKFTQAIRGTCNDPVAGVQTANDPAQGSSPAVGSQPAIGNHFTPATIAAAIHDIESSGHTPYVLWYDSQEEAWLQQAVGAQFGNGTVTPLLNQQTDDDEHIYLGEPKDTVSETFTIYSWEPGK